jgi:hypothetical protein
VLAEARAAVVGGSRSRSWLRWSAPVALAASVVLVVAVVIESPVQHQTLAIQPAGEDSYEPNDADEYQLQEESAQARQRESEPQIIPEQPPAAVPAAVRPAAPPPASAAKTEAKRADRATVVEEVLVNAEASRPSFATSPVAVDTVTLDSAEAQLAAERPAPAIRAQATSARNEVDRAARPEDSSAKASASAEVQEIAVTGTRQRRSAGRTAGPRNTISGSAFETRPAADADAEQSDPAKWLEEIRDLRRAAKTAEADAAWERFREAFPDFPVAQDDVARKKP